MNKRLIVVLGVVGVLAGVPTLTIAAGLNDTGITTCSNATQNGLPCPVDGFPRQDAEYGRDAAAAAGTLTKIGGGEAGFDFTKISNSGAELPANATLGSGPNDWACTRDNVTGAMWEVKTNDGGLRDQNKTYTFDESANYATSVNSAGLCGFNDWQMPTVTALMSIAHHGRTNPAIDTAYFPNTPSSWFWSGSPNAYYSDYAWYVYFSYGNAYGNGRDYNYRVRLVRGGQSFDNFDSFVLSVNKTGSGTGIITSSDGVIDCGSSCSAELNSSDKIILTSSADVNSTFAGWSGACTNKTGSCTVTMDKAQTVTATFNAAPVTYKLSISKVGNGTVTSKPTGINCGGNCSASFNKGASITLTAAPASGYTFVSWTGCTASATNQLQCQFTLTANKAITATFAAIPADNTLTVKTIGNGNVSSNPAGIDCGTGSACVKSFGNNATVMLTAAPATGETLIKWDGCTVAMSNPQQCRVVLNANKNVTAQFSDRTALYADVRVTSIVLNPTTPTINKPFTATITIKNSGNTALDAGEIEVWLDQRDWQPCSAMGDAFDMIGTLNPGQSKTLTAQLTATTPGSKRLHVFADSQCVTAELHEGNNQAVKRYTVK